MFSKKDLISLYSMYIYNFVLCLQRQQTWDFWGVNVTTFRFYWTFRWQEKDFMLIYILKISIISFVMLLVHGMEFWSFKMLIWLKYHMSISRLLDFLFCVLYINGEKIPLFWFACLININCSRNINFIII